jgi:hypothetical protein
MCRSELQQYLDFSNVWTSVNRSIYRALLMMVYRVLIIGIQMHGPLIMAAVFFCPAEHSIPFPGGVWASIMTQRQLWIDPLSRQLNADPWRVMDSWPSRRTYEQNGLVVNGRTVQWDATYEGSNSGVRTFSWTF